MNSKYVRSARVYVYPRIRDLDAKAIEFYGMYNRDVDMENSYRIWAYDRSTTVYSFVDQNNCTFWVHVVVAAHVFCLCQEIYTLYCNFEFPSFGFDRRFRDNHYKAISLCMTRSV